MAVTGRGREPLHSDERDSPITDLALTSAAWRFRYCAVAAVCSRQTPRTASGDKWLLTKRRARALPRHGVFSYILFRKIQLQHTQTAISAIGHGNISVRSLGPHAFDLISAPAA